MSAIAAAIDELAEDFSLLSDWEERYAHLLDLARAMPALPEVERVEANKVRGCASQVWFVFERRPEASAPDRTGEPGSASGAHAPGRDGK